MTTIRDLPTDMIIVILSGLSWRDLYNFCLAQPDVCDNPLIKAYVNNRIEAITSNLFERIITISSRDYKIRNNCYHSIIWEFKATDQHDRRFFIDIGMVYATPRANMYVISPPYIFTEVYYITINNAKTFLNRYGKTFKYVECHNITYNDNLREIIRRLLIEGYIEDDLHWIRKYEYEDIINVGDAYFHGHDRYIITHFKKIRKRLAPLT